MDGWGHRLGRQKEREGIQRRHRPNSKWLHISEWTFEDTSVVKTQNKIFTFEILWWWVKTKGKLKFKMETWHTFAMHIHHGTDLELSPTTTIMVLFLFFFKWQWSQCIRKQYYHLAASRGTLCTETCTVRAHGFLEDRGLWLPGLLRLQGSWTGI